MQLIVNLRHALLLKCKFAAYCRYYRQDAHTCHDDKEARSYCGARWQFDEFAKGTSNTGEGLPLGTGEIPLSDILINVNSLGKLIQGTIELREGHLNRGKLQKQSVKWLLENSLV